jgi:hypothetical protein
MEKDRTTKEERLGRAKKKEVVTDVMKDKYIVISVLIVALVLGTLTLINSNQNRAEEIRQTIEKEQMIRHDVVKVAYYQCLADAWTDYSANWDQQCGVDGKVDSCTLSGLSLERVESGYEKAQDTCLDIYNIELMSQ